MITIIRNAHVYNPENIGRCDIVFAGKTIIYVGNDHEITTSSKLVTIIDATDSICFPGFIDNHVHICGGGGEGSFKTRIPELQLADFIKAGVTTVIGVLGTDGFTRSMDNLLAKARGLDEEGISTYILTGSYQVPIRTLTENIEKDIITVDKIIGVGEVALADHRSSQPNYDDFLKLSASSRVAGLLSGKAGVVNIHMGSGADKLKYLKNAIENTEIPISIFVPTHITRNEELFADGLEYAKNGGYIDFTAVPENANIKDDNLDAGKALKRALDYGVSIKNITFSSDGGGSLPVFDKEGKFLSLKIGKMDALFNEVKKAVVKHKIPFEKAIKVITQNPAEIFKLKNKGKLEKGYDADIVLINKHNFEISYMIAKGQIMMADNKILVKGVFE